MNDFAEIKRLLNDPHQVVTWLGLGERAKRNGNGLLICCPRHGEKNPSCSIKPGDDGNLFVKCFACDFAGDVFRLISEVYQLDLKSQSQEILRIAADQAGYRLAEERKAEKLPPRPQPRPITPPKPAEPPLEDSVFHALASELLKLCPLKAQEDVAAYLEKRQLLKEASADGWGALPKDEEEQRHIKAALVQAVGLAAWTQSGLAYREGFTWSEHRLIIPWRSAGGRIFNLQRRLIGKPPERGPGKYIFTKGRPLLWPYGVDWPCSPANSGAFAHPLTPQTAIVFVEGATDVLAQRIRYRRKGLDRVVLGLPGVANWRKEWANFAKGRIAVLCFDADKAGEDNLVRVSESLYLAKAASVEREWPKEAKDWAELLEKEFSKR